MTTVTLATRTVSAPRDAALWRLRHVVSLFLAAQLVGVVLRPVAAALVLVALWQVRPLLLGTPRVRLAHVALAGAASWLLATLVAALVVPSEASRGVELSELASVPPTVHPIDVVLWVTWVATLALFAMTLSEASRRLRLAAAAASWRASAWALLGVGVVVSFALLVAAALAAAPGVGSLPLTDSQRWAVGGVAVLVALLSWGHVIFSGVRTLRLTG